MIGLGEAVASRIIATSAASTAAWFPSFAGTPTPLPSLGLCPGLHSAHPPQCTCSRRPRCRRYAGEHISASLTLPLRKRPGAALGPKLCQYLRPKIHPLLLDAAINSQSTILLNIYQVLHWVGAGGCCTGIGWAGAALGLGRRCM